MIEPAAPGASSESQKTPRWTPGAEQDLILLNRAWTKLASIDWRQSRLVAIYPGADDDAYLHLAFAWQARPPN